MAETGLPQGMFDFLKNIAKTGANKVNGISSFFDKSQGNNRLYQDFMNQKSIISGQGNSVSNPFTSPNSNTFMGNTMVGMSDDANIDTLANLEIPQTLFDTRGGLGGVTGGGQVNLMNPNTFSTEGGMFDGLGDMGWGGVDSTSLDPALMNVDVSGADTGSFMDFFGTTGSDGKWNAGPASAIASMGKGIFDSWLGMEQLGLAEDMFDEQSAMARENLAISKKDYNTNLEDRQNARYAANQNAYASTDDYMAKNKLT